MKKLRFRIRTWLNREPDQTAFLLANVEAEVGGHVSAAFKIADCNRIVALDFDVWSRERVNDRLHKLAVLRQALEKFEEAYRKALVESGMLTLK